MDFSSIQDIDFQILQWFNGSNNVILDQLVMALTSGFTWIPLYLVLFIIVMRNNETVGQIGLIVGCAFLCILLPMALPRESSNRLRQDGDLPTIRW